MTTSSTGAPQSDQSGQPIPTANQFEASLAPRDGDLLSLPFDQYGRMRIVQTVLNTLYAEIGRNLTPPQRAEGDTGPLPDTPFPTPHSPLPTPHLTVLDVGGYPGVLRHFLNPDYYTVYVLDVAPDDGSIPNYTQGSGMDLPYPSSSFDVVTALDTLEHIPNPERERFLSEVMRVARHAVVLVNPIQSIEADVAEETLDEYIRWILDAQQEQLREHRDFGLPDFGVTQTAFTRAGWRTLGFPVANVYNWLLMMVAKHYLISLRDERASGFERTLDRFYNLTFSDSDRAQPAYRGVILAVRPGLEGALAHIQGDYPPVPSADQANTVRLQLTSVLMQLLDLKTANHEDRLLRGQIERRDLHITGMEQQVAVLSLQLERAQQELTRAVDVSNMQLDHANQNLTHADADIQRLNGELDRTGRELSQAHSEMQELQVRLGHKDRHIANLTSQMEGETARLEALIERLESEVRGKNEHILYMEKLLQGIEAGRVLRVTRRVSRLLGR